jgi:protease I
MMPAGVEGKGLQRRSGARTDLALSLHASDPPDRWGPAPARDQTIQEFSRGSNMSGYDLTDRKIAVLATDGFERSELFEPLQALRKAGATTHIVSPGGERGEMIRAWEHGEWKGGIEVDVPIAEADPDDYDGLLIPGGVINPDKLRRDERCVGFVRAFFEDGKPVAAICHAPWMLVEAGVVKGRRLTSFHSIRTDLINAGANWVDEEVVVDQGLVTSRNPDDLPAFTEKMLEEFYEGAHSVRMN